jgi:hypothetical protein
MSTPTFNDYEFHIRSLQEQNEVLTQRLQSAAHLLERASSVTAGIAPKVSMPDKYSGEAAGYRGFKSSLTLLFQLHSVRYPDDLTKILTVGSLLSGKALNWFAPLLEAHTSGFKPFGSYTEFMNQFGISFGPVDVAITSAYSLDKLKQGKMSAATYATQFKQLASDLSWGQEALIFKFRAGLNDPVKDILVGKDVPDSLDALIEMSIRADQMLYQRSLERRAAGGSHASSVSQGSSSSVASVSGNRSNVTNAVGPIPMQLDVIQRRGPLTDDERTHRMRNRLCIVCGVAGHFKNDCPISRNKETKQELSQGKEQSQ